MSEYKLTWTAPGSDVTYSLSDYRGRNVDDLKWLGRLIKDAGQSAELTQKDEQQVAL